jgi:hypothetical protein
MKMTDWMLKVKPEIGAMIVFSYDEMSLEVKTESDWWGSFKTSIW